MYILIFYYFSILYFKSVVNLVPYFFIITNVNFNFWIYHFIFFYLLIFYLLIFFVK